MSNKKSLEFLRIINEQNDSSGFLDVHKVNADNSKGYKWIYYYNEHGQRKSISNIHLLVLKYFVCSMGFPWKVINESKAQESLDLEKSKNDLFDEGTGILFVDVIYEKFHPFKGFWRYRFDKMEVLGTDLGALAKDVKKMGLPWIVLNDANYENSIRLGIDFDSGILMVNKIRFERNTDLFRWAFIFKSDDEYELLINDDLNLLKEDVIENGFSWEVIDEDRFNSSLIENEHNLGRIEHYRWSETGIYRVRKIKQERCRQGFHWIYRFRDNYKRTEISSTDLLELKEKVLNKGFEWKIIDRDLADESFRENELNLDKYQFSANKNKTGVFRVYKNKSNRSIQGFYWVYGYSIDKKRKRISSVNLENLKEKVLSKGLPWKVIDEEKYEKSLKENEENIEKYYRLIFHFSEIL